MRPDSKPVGRQIRYRLVGLLVLFSISCGLVDGVSERVASGGSEVGEPNIARTAWPTFTPSATIDIAQLAPTATNPPLPPPTETPTPPPPPPPTETPPPPPPPTETPPPPGPRANVINTVNVRTGPSTAYRRLGQVTNGHTSDVLGRNQDNSWILINYSGGQGWIFAPLAEIEGDLNLVDVVPVDPPPPEPQAATSAPPPPPPPSSGPSYPYKLTNVFGERNGAITQIRGIIKDGAGQPANGVRVRVRIGTFCTISVPSGTPGVYPPGNYDILLRPYASDSEWLVSIVDRPTNPEDHSCDPGAQQLSEEVRVTTSTQEGVTYVEFQGQ